ncbi:MAG TPA: sugar ABC transporter substrate-binding protein [Baekduia sp.]|nr:sugar ABC transporter substrate-binding protein [Baekduia sp.]
MWNRRWTAASAALAVCAFAAGCGSDDDKAADKSTNKAAKIAYLTYSYQDYQQTEQAGMEEAVSKDGGSVKSFNANFDPGMQQKQCLDVITSRRYNAIVLSPVSSPTAVGCVKAAKNAGVPVITLEGAVGNDPSKLEPQVEGVVGVVALPPNEGGQTLSQLVALACDGKDPCKVIADLIPGDVYGEAYDKAISATPGVKIVQRINSMYDNTRMQKAMPDALSAHPDADVLITIGDNTAVAALPAIKDAGLTGKIKVIGAGGSRQGAAGVKDGQLFATAGTWPRLAGTIAGGMAVKAVNGQKIDPVSVNAQKINKPELVTKENVDQFKPEWGPAAN